MRNLRRFVELCYLNLYNCRQSLSLKEQFTDRHFVQRMVDWKSHKLVIAGTSGMFLSTTEQKEETQVSFGSKAPMVSVVISHSSINQVI